MSLTTMSFKEANAIIELYSGILRNSLNLGKFEKFRYSELKGYDIFDIDNALKIFTAYRVFKSPDANAVVLEKLKKEADENSGACLSFFNSFAPDSVVQQLMKLDTNDIYSRSKSFELEGNVFESSLFMAFSKTENHLSFLDFCLSIGNTDVNYWEKVYDRIGITWDERNEFDEIYFIILNKHLYFEELRITTEQTKSTSENKVSNDLISSFYSRNKKLVGNTCILIILSVGLVYLPLRILIFCICAILGLVQLYFWTKEPIENKLSFALNLFYSVLYITGIFLNQYSFYILIFITGVHIFNLIKDAITLKVANSVAAGSLAEDPALCVQIFQNQ